MGEEEVTANNCNNVLAKVNSLLIGEDMLLQAVTLFLGSDLSLVHPINLSMTGTSSLSNSF